MFRLTLSHLQALLKYRSKVSNDHIELWDPKRLNFWDPRMQYDWDY